MAKTSQGTTVTWGGTTFTEVVSVGVDGVQTGTVEIVPRTSTRALRFSSTDIDYGSVTMTARSPTGMVTGNVGTTAALTISAPLSTWTFATAIYERLNWQAATGELQTFSVTFKIGG
jgi:hypothetical protein